MPQRAALLALKLAVKEAGKIDDQSQRNHVHCH